MVLTKGKVKLTLDGTKNGGREAGGGGVGVGNSLRMYVQRRNANFTMRSPDKGV